MLHSDQCPRKLLIRSNTVVHKLIISTSAIAKANKDVVCSKVYNSDKIKRDYHPLLATFFGVSPFQIKYQNITVLICRHPDAFGDLRAAKLLGIQDLKVGIKQ